MNYEKEYNEALERAREILKHTTIEAAIAIKKILPSLDVSEDESIRKFLIGYFKSYKIGNVATKLNGIRIDDCIAWLEKQKEPEHICDSAQFEEGFKTGFEIGLRKQKEQKPAEWALPEDFEEAVYKVANFISPFDSNEELRKVSHRFAEQLLSLAKKELDKPAEWSEEDEQTIKEILGVIYEASCGIYRPFERDTYKRWESWLKSLSLNLKKKNEDVAKLCSNEWSEEDEETLACAISVFEDFVECKNVSVPPASAKRYLNRLKSLRPQPKWKPSEEQMEALKCAIEDVAKFSKRGGRQVELENEPYYSALHSLYCNLEKLMEE